MKYIIFFMWLSTAMFLSIIFSAILILDEPMTVFFGWLFLIGLLIVMIPSGYYSIRGLSKKVHSL